MSPSLGWGLAVLGVAAGYVQFGWPGVLLAVTAIVFWLLLQFGRALRVMRDAGRRPVGSVDSAVRLDARLRPGMSVIQVIKITGSLGRRVSEEPERWAWADAGGTAVVLSLQRGKVGAWELSRPAE